MKALYKIFIIIFILSSQIMFGQLTNEDYKIIKFFPPIKREMVNPKTYTYKSERGVVLSYVESEGKLVDTEADLRLMDEGLPNVGESLYSDGAVDAWVEGKFTVGNTTYDLHGSYIAEGYLQGVLYDNNKKVFGLLDWEFADAMTATLKTEKETYIYKMIYEDQINKLKPSKSGSEALRHLSKKNKEQEKPDMAKSTGSGIAIISDNTKYDFFVDDFLILNNLTKDLRIDMLKKWGWIIEQQIKSRKGNLYMTFTKRNSVSMKKIILSYIQNKGNEKLHYELTMCTLKDINEFVEDSKKKGFKAVNDKDSVLKLISLHNAVTVIKSDMQSNIQYFTIRIE